MAFHYLLLMGHKLWLIFFWYFFHYRSLSRLFFESRHMWRYLTEAVHRDNWLVSLVMTNNAQSELLRAEPAKVKNQTTDHYHVTMFRSRDRAALCFDAAFPLLHRINLLLLYCSCLINPLALVRAINLCTIWSCKTLWNSGALRQIAWTYRTEN